MQSLERGFIGETVDICPQGPGLGGGVTLETVNVLPQVQGLGVVCHGDRGPENPGARSVKLGYCDHDTTVQGQGGWVILRMWACDPMYKSGEDFPWWTVDM